MSGIFLTTPSVRKLTGTFVDAGGSVSTVLVIAWVIRFGRGAASVAEYESFYLKLAVLTATFLVCFYYNDLYVDRAPRDRKSLLFRMLKSHLAAGVFLSLVYYVLPALALGRGILFSFFPLALPSLFLWRAVYYWGIEKGSLVENVLIIGTGETAKEMAREILLRKGEGYRVVGFLTDEPTEVGVRLVNPSVIGVVAELPMLSRSLKVDTLVVAMEDRRGKLPLSELLRCKLTGVRVEEATTFYETLTGQLPVRNMRPGWLVFSSGFQKSHLFHGTRRALEIFLALVALVISLPVLVVTALLVLLESGRPILYRQERVGQKGEVFPLYKLRTMRLDAEEETGAVWASADGDPRVTWVGRFLRGSRLDELPQLFNVLKGDMSFVGPRPERPFFVEKLRKVIPYYDERHYVKPGITGWAQVRYRYGSSVEEAEVKLRYDLYYIKNMSFWLDFVILMDTVKVILSGEGVR